MGECDQATGIYSFNVAWKRKYWGWAPDEGWFILTNLSDLESAILAYKNALELRRCARDFKSGGYNLEAPGSQKSPGCVNFTLLLLPQCRVKNQANGVTKTSVG